MIVSRLVLIILIMLLLLTGCGTATDRLETIYTDEIDATVGTFGSLSIDGENVDASTLVTSVSGSSPISSSGGTSPTISIATADTSTTGAISAADWNLFYEGMLAAQYYPQGDTSTQLYAPLYDWDLRSSPFTTKDQNLLSATVTGTTWGTQGRTFDGIDDLINCGSNAALDDLGPVTIHAWIKPTTLGELSAGRIFHKRTLTGDTAGLMVSLSDTNALYFARDFVTTDLFRFASNNAITLGSWQLVSVTWDGTTTAANVHIYINGVETTYQTTTDGVGALVSDAAYDFIIGNTPAGARTFDGIIGEVLIYNRALTPTEVMNIYLATKWRYQ